MGVSHQFGGLHWSIKRQHSCALISDNTHDPFGSNYISKADTQVISAHLILVYKLVSCHSGSHSDTVLDLMGHKRRSDL